MKLNPLKVPQFDYHKMILNSIFTALLMRFLIYLRMHHFLRIRDLTTELLKSQQTTKTDSNQVFSKDHINHSHIDNFEMMENKEDRK